MMKQEQVQLLEKVNKSEELYSTTLEKLQKAEIETEKIRIE